MDYFVDLTNEGYIFTVKSNKSDYTIQLMLGCKSEPCTETLYSIDRSVSIVDVAGIVKQDKWLERTLEEMKEELKKEIAKLNLRKNIIKNIEK